MDASSAARRLSLTLAHFPSVCTGNETYLSASYWHVVATTLDALTAAYLYIGAIGCTAPRIHANVATATAIDTIRLFMTRNTENVNDSSDPPSSYGLVMIRSWRMPYTRSDPTTPTTQPTTLTIVARGGTRGGTRPGIASGVCVCVVACARVVDDLSGLQKNAHRLVAVTRSSKVVLLEHRAVEVHLVLLPRRRLDRAHAVLRDDGPVQTRVIRRVHHAPLREQFIGQFKGDAIKC